MRSLTRKDFLKISGVAAAGLVAASAAYIYLNDESETIVVERLTLPIKGLKSALEGFTILQISDIHLLPLTQPELVRQAVEIANSLQPDLTLLTGDYVWTEIEAMHSLTPIISNLNARYGVFTSLGNHDLWTDIRVVTQGLAEAGLPLLVNQGLPLGIGKEILYLAAVDDCWSGKPDLAAALEGVPEAAPVILMAHEPDTAEKFAKDGRISVQLSGHSHGGQVRIPGIGAIVLPYLAWKYDMGLYKLGEMWLYTNRGLGITNVALRFNCPPEITLITLVAS
jgi:predicted MPP superfamily phosphohydrolase